MVPLIQVKHLGKQLSSVWIWRNLNFVLPPGGKMAVVGPSGSGKSVLFRVLAGLEDAQEGKIFFQNHSLDSRKLPQYRSQAIYLPQNPSLLEGTVESNLQFVFRFSSHRSQTYNRPKILTALSSLGKAETFLTRQAHELSGGEAQIIALLRALQLTPLILFLDEPTASLDAETEKTVETMIQSWQTENPKCAYLCTSHDLAQLERMTEQTLFLKASHGQ